MKWLIGTLVLFIIIAGIVFYPFSAKTTVTAVSLPATQVPPGEATLFRFAVTAEGSDTEVEQIYLIFTSDQVSLGDLYLYDEATGTEISGAAYYNSEGLVRFWPGGFSEERLKVPGGTTKVFALRGNVRGEGTVTFKMEDMITVQMKNMVEEGGSVAGLPTVTTSLTIQK